MTGYGALLLGAVALAVGVSFALEAEWPAVGGSLVFVAYNVLFARDAFRHARRLAAEPDSQS